jgi:predicted dehydrogenase
MSKRALRLAVVGAGTIAESVHLPLLTRRDDLSVDVIVETNRERGAAVARRFGIPSVADSICEIPAGVDAALVLLPHALHCGASTELLGRGLHVLVEKPMAVTTAECREMVDAAERAGRVLAVGLMRRFSPVAGWVKALIESGRLGALRSFEASEGSIYGYKSATDSFFRKGLAGGGVLLDVGVHVLDLCLWWLGEPEGFEYFDDVHGGVEADCEMRLRFVGGGTARVELSRTRNLPAEMRLVGELGTVSFSLFGDRIDADGAAGDFTHGGISAHATPQLDMLAWFGAQFDNWVAAIRGEGDLLIDGKEGMRSISLLESCYRQRRPLQLPWMPWATDLAEVIQ